MRSALSFEALTVGLSNAILLAENNTFYLLDIDESKVEKINRGVSPIAEKDIEDYMKHKSATLIATSNEDVAYKGAEYVFIATPTNYSETIHSFDTSIVEYVIRKVKKIEPNAHLIIKSTVPIGFTKKISAELGVDDIFFSPRIFT